MRKRGRPQNPGRAMADVQIWNALHNAPNTLAAAEALAGQWAATKTAEWLNGFYMEAETIRQRYLWLRRHMPDDYERQVREVADRLRAERCKEKL